MIRVGRMLSISAFGRPGHPNGGPFDTSHVLGSHRLGVAVTVRIGGDLVRDAIVMLVPTAHRSSVRQLARRDERHVRHGEVQGPVASTTLGHRST